MIADEDAGPPCLRTLPDAAVVRRCRAGHDAAWEELVRRYSRYVYSITTRAFRLGADDAEDIVQDVFARTYEHLDRLRDDDAIRPWIAQLSRRRCIDHIRLRGRELLTDEAVEPAHFVDMVERLDESLTVQDALSSLPEHAREVLDRFFVRDEPYETIAVALGIPKGTIASRIHRSLSKLRDELVADEQYQLAA